MPYSKKLEISSRIIPHSTLNVTQHNCPRQQVSSCLWWCHTENEPLPQGLPRALDFGSVAGDLNIGWLKWENRWGEEKKCVRFSLEWKGQCFLLSHTVCSDCSYNYQVCKCYCLQSSLLALYFCLSRDNTKDVKHKSQFDRFFLKSLQEFDCCIYFTLVLHW